MAPPANKDTLFLYVATAKLDNWHGSSYDFIRHWITQRQMLHTLTEEKDRISAEGYERLNFMFVSNTVSNFPSLHTVPMVAKVEKIAADGTPYKIVMDLTFTEYLNNLTTACLALDRDQPSCLNHFTYDFFDHNTDVRTVVRHMQLVSNNPNNIVQQDAVRELTRLRMLKEIESDLAEGIDDSRIPPGHDYTSDSELIGTELYRSMEHNGSFIDRHGIRGVAGADVRVIHRTQHSLNITEVLGRRISGLVICTVGAVVNTTRGRPLLLVMPQYVYAGTGKTVHSWAQIAHGRNRIYCEEVEHNPHRRFESPAMGIDFIQAGWGNVVIDVIHGRPHIKMRPYTDEEWNGNLGRNRVTLTCDKAWQTEDMLDTNHAKIAKTTVNLSLIHI